VRYSDRSFVQANSDTALFDAVQAEDPRRSTEDAIVEICERLLSEAEAEPPTPIERVASLRGIVDIERREQPWAGTLEPRGAHFVVGVRGTDSYERQRFTILHEASHTFFRGFAERAQFRCNGERTELEQRCDLAASELLMPRRYFANDLTEAEFNFQTVEDLAAAYEASIEATTLRVARLWREPALALTLSERHKPSEQGREDVSDPKLRLDYSYGRGDWPYLFNHKSVESHSPLGRALDGELVDERGTLDELCHDKMGPLEIHARRYGARPRVLALIRHASNNERR
jgi:IrrE N-terminal-like domain